MQKDTYTDEDVQNILQSLFVEKKRVKALQGKIQIIGEERNQLREQLQTLSNRPPQKKVIFQDEKLKAEKFHLEKQNAHIEEMNKSLESKLQVLKNFLLKKDAELDQAKSMVNKRSGDEQSIVKELEIERQARARALEALAKHKSLSERNRKAKYVAERLKKKHGDLLNLEKKLERSQKNLELEQSKVEKEDINFKKLSLNKLEFRKEVTALEGSLRNAQLKVDAIQLQKDALEEKNGLLEEKKLEGQREVKALQGDLLNLDKENMELKASVLSLEPELETLRLALDRANTHLESNCKELVEAADFTEDLKSENVELRTDRQEFEALLKSAQHELEAAREEAEWMKNEALKVRGDLEIFKEENEGTIAEQKRQILKLAKHYKLTKERLSKTEGLYEEREKLIQQMIEDKSLVEKDCKNIYEQEEKLELRLRKTEESLRNTEADALRSRQDLLEAQAQYQAMKDKLESHGSVLAKKCQEEVEHYQERFQVMQSKFEDQKNRNQRLKEDKKLSLQAFIKAFDFLNEAVGVMEVDQPSFLTTEEEVLALLEHPERCSQRIKEVSNGLKAQIESLLDEKSREKLALEESRREGRRLDEELETASREHEILNQQLTDVQKNLNLVNDEQGLREERIKELQELLNSVEEHSRFQEEQLNRLKQTTEANSETNLEMSDEFNRVQENYKKELDTVREELIKEKQSAEALESERSCLNGELEKVQSDLEEKVEALTSLQKSSLAHEEKIKELSTQLATEKSLLQSKGLELGKILETVDQLEEELEKKRVELKLKNTELEQNELEFSKKDKKFHSKANELEKLKETTESEHAELEEARLEIRRLEGIEELIRDELRASKEIFQSQSTDLVEELNLTKKKASVLEEEKKEMCRQFEGRKSEYQTLEKEVQHIKQGLARGVCEAKDVEGRYFDALEEKFELVNRYKALAQKHKEQHQRLQALLGEAQRMKKENLNLKGIQEESKSSLELAQGENQEFQERANAWEKEYEKIALEKKTVTAQLEKVVSEESRLKETMTLLEGRVGTLETCEGALQETQSQLETEREEGQALFKSLDSLKAEKEILKGSLEEKEKHILDLCSNHDLEIAQMTEEQENKIGTLKGRLVNLEAKLSDLSVVETEKLGLEQKHEALNGEHQELVKRLEQMSTVHQDLDSRLGKLSQRYRECQSVLHEKTEILKGSKDLKIRLQEQLKEAESSHQELNSQFAVLQQHFKRKVKENALQVDMLKKQKVEKQSLEGELINARGEMKKLSASLDMQRVHDEKIQLMTKDTLNIAERRSKEWQEKYFAIHEKWQNNNMRIKEFEKIQVEYQQVQEFMSKMRHFVGAGMSMPSQQAAVLQASAQNALNSEFVQELETKKVVAPVEAKQADVLQDFESRPNKRSRRTLFED